MTYEVPADRVKAYNLRDKFMRYKELSQEQLTPYTLEERIEKGELEDEISNALYWMQRRLTQADLWLEFEDGRMFANRDQKTVDRLRNIRDALPWDQARWSGEKN